MTARPPLPEQIAGDGLVLRRWRVEDAETLLRVVAESAAFLRPWLLWPDEEPATLPERRAELAESEAVWRAGGTVRYAILDAGEVAGGGSLIAGDDDAVLEIGYWLHPAFTGRGIATRAARLMLDAALAHPGVTSVEIRHDVANVASGAVPRRLGFRFDGNAPNPVPSTADTGTDEIWRIP